MTASDLDDLTLPSVLEAAMAAADRGWRVLPVWGVDSGVCLCPMGAKCDKKPGKHPIERGWQDQATTDVSTIRRWWAKYPRANLGLATGKESGFFVFDVDGDTGRASLADIGEIPETLTVITGSGGLHFYYAYPATGEVRNKQGLYPGIDIRGDGGFVVAAPSIHLSGNRYRFSNPNAPIVDSGFAHTLQPKEQPRAPIAPMVHTDQTKKASAYLAKIPGAIAGSDGHKTTFKAAVSLVKGFALSEEQAFAMLAAEYNPRCQPPWTEKELRHKVADAARSTQLPEGFIANRPSHLRPVPREPFADFETFRPSSPPPDYVPPPSDDDAPPELVTFTYEEFESLVEDDVSNAVKPDIFAKALTLKIHPEQWLRVGQLMRRKKIKREFDAMVKKHDRGPLHKPSGWAKALLVREDKNGFPVLENCLHNIATILSHDPAWVGVLALDEFSNQIVTRKDPPFAKRTKRWLDEDAAEVCAWIEVHYPIRPKIAAVHDAVLLVAKRQHFNACTDYLDGLESHDKECLDTWLTDVFGAPDTPYTRAVGAKFMISMVARAYDPGCKVDSVLILEGEQEIKKSRTLQNLVPNPEWFVDGLSDFGSKAQAEELEGKWLVELGELAGFSRSETDKIKAFVTRQRESYRPAYARHSIVSPRRCVFAGSVNPSGNGYLRDETGNRRFWPVECTKLAPEMTTEMRDNLLSEARDRYRNGEAWWLEDAELKRLAAVEQKKRVSTDPWHERVESELTVEINEISTDEILQLLKVETPKRGNAEQQRVGRIMLMLGWGKVRRKLASGQQVWRYVRPADVISPISQSL